MFTSEDHSAPVTLRSWIALVTSINLSFALCYLACTSTLQTSSRLSALYHAAFYLLLATAAGFFSTALLLPAASRLHNRALKGSSLRVWLFLPAIAISLHHQSLNALVLAAFAAILLALHLRQILPVPEPPPPATIFAAEITHAPASSLPFAVVLCLYFTIIALFLNRLIPATLLFALATFLLTLYLTGSRKASRQKTRFIYVLVIFALACTFLALTSTHIWIDPLLGRSLPRIIEAPPLQQVSGHAAPGFTTIVILPPLKHEKTLPSPPRKTNISTPGTAQPWIIPFTGPYWYFKVPGTTPGPTARTVHADPLKASVHSSDRFDLLMEAHQTLDRPIDLACCRQIQLVFRNDASLGAVAVGLTLTDTLTPNHPTQDLGAIHVDANDTQSEDPAEQTLTYLIPSRPTATRFNEITVTLVPSANQRTLGRRVQIERFVMTPN